MLGERGGGSGGRGESMGWGLMERSSQGSKSAIVSSLKQLVNMTRVSLNVDRRIATLLKTLKRPALMNYLV